MADEPVVILRRDGAKVVLIQDRNKPLIIEPSRTTSVTIQRSGIAGPPGREGPPGRDGAIVYDGNIPEILDGGFA